MSMKRLIDQLSEAKDGGDYGTMMMAIADRVTRKGPKGIFYAFDDLLREASKDRSKRGTLVRILKDIEANGGLTGLRLPTGERMPDFKTGFLQDRMGRYIEAAQNGDERVKRTPEEDAASADFDRRAKEAFERRLADFQKARADEDFMHMKQLINRLEEAQDTGADNILASFHKSWMDGSSDFKDLLQILRNGGKDANKIGRYLAQDQYQPKGKGKVSYDVDLVSGKKGTTTLSIMVNDSKPVTASISLSAKDGGDGLVSVKIYAGKNEEEVSVDEFLDMVRFRD